MGAVVVPDGRAAEDLPSRRVSVRRLLAWAASVVAALWGYVEVGHHGQYSLERLCAFDEYCRSTSRARIFVTCAVTPLLPLLLIVALELIPLHDPSRGWQANYALFIRAFFSALVVAHCVSMQAKTILPEVALTHLKCAAVSIATATAYVAVLLLLASTWAFPVPFSVAICSAPFTFFFMFFGAMAIGRAPFQTNPSLWKRFRQFLFITIIQVTLTLIYPAYNAVFIRLSMFEQAAFVLLLPAIKTTVKLVLSQHVTHIEDLLPEIAVVSVEVFHALYLSTSMQNTDNSPLVTIVILFLDAIHLVIAFRRLHERTQTLKRYLDASPLSSSVNSSGIVSSMLQICGVLAANPRNSTLQRLRLRSIVHHTLSHDVRKLLESLEDRCGRDEKPSESTKTRTFSVFLSQPTFPNTESPLIASTLSSTETGARTLPLQLEDEYLLCETLQLLFTCEYLVLSEYIECMVPTFYLLYLAIAYCLPNAQYNPQIHSMSVDKLHATLGYLAMYAALELLSLVTLHRVLWRKFSLPPLRLLAFVLETQREMIVGKLVAWALIILQLPLVHFGLDFSFRFSWARSAPT